MIATVNPNILVTVRRNQGYTTSPDGTRIPTYTDVPNIVMNSQAISGGSGSDGPILQHLDGLGIQGTLRAFWVAFPVEAVNRTTNKGGDLILIPKTLLMPPSTYLAVQMVEAFDTSGWTHFIGQLQDDDT